MLSPKKLVAIQEIVQVKTYKVLQAHYLAICMESKGDMIDKDDILGKKMSKYW